MILVRFTGFLDPCAGLPHFRILPINRALVQDHVVQDHATTKASRYWSPLTTSVPSTRSSVCWS